MSRPIFAAYIAAMTAAFGIAFMTVFAAPAIGAETPNRLDEIGLMAYYGGDENPEPSQPIYQRRETFTHIHKFCEPQFNPAEGWLRPNGYCGLTDQTSKGSLIYSGEDYNFGFKS